MLTQKLLHRISPVKRILKDMNLKQLLQLLLMLIKDVIQELFLVNNKHTDFGPFLKVTDLYQKVALILVLIAGALGSGTGA